MNTILNKDGVFIPATAGVAIHTIEYVYSDAGGCTNKATKTIEVVAAPGTVTASSNSPVLVGGALTLTASNLTGATYKWTGPNGFTSTAQNPSRTGVTSAMAGTYTVVATVNGCSSPAATVTVTVNQPALISSFSPTSGTVGTSVTIKGSGFTGSTSVKFNGTAATYTVVDNQTITATVADGSTTGLISVTTPTGTVTSSSNFTVLPTTVTVAGTVRSQLGTALTNVVVKATTGNTQTSATTSVSGAFSLKLNQGQAYTVAPAKRNETSVTNGVTTLDIVQIQRHILGIEALSSPYRIIAADVNLSNSVTTLDIALVRSLILHNTTSFPGNRTWAFVKSDFSFANPALPFPYDSVRTYSKATELSNQDFIGVKLGDVNDSWDAATARTGISGSVAFQMENQEATRGTEIIVPVAVKGFSNVSGYQFTLDWDPKVLEFSRIEHAGVEGFYGTHSVLGGKLTTAWTEPNGRSLSLKDGANAFYVRFRVVGETGSESKVNIGSSLTRSVAYNGSLGQLDVEAKNALVKVKGLTYALHQNYPNPFTGKTALHFEVPEDQDVQLTIYNALGQTVRRISGKFVAGEHFVDWKGDDAEGRRLSNGTYFCRMRAGKFTDTIQIILAD
ncbi:T9SS type A sorting domain-containing protein [Sabulibacter ruber]|uniref:T9SS type A sorting domain-containing protein n=1 Tax=Sabulibacter ruber TaxID=2811901 RepID=UPI003100C77B